MFNAISSFLAKVIVVLIAISSFNSIIWSNSLYSAMSKAKDITWFSNLILLSQNKSKKVNSIFEHLLTELEKKSKIPFVLPVDIESKKESKPLYANIHIANDNKYEIIIGFSEDCDGGNACRWGSVSGELNRGEKVSGEKVLLSKNITGYFREAKCGAVCSDSKITWLYGRYKYSVGIKAAKKELLVAMANSAIE